MFQNKTGLDAKANSELYKSKRVNSDIIVYTGGSYVERSLLSTQTSIWPAIDLVRGPNSRSGGNELECVMGTQTLTKVERSLGSGLLTKQYCTYTQRIHFFVQLIWGAHFPATWPLVATLHGDGNRRWGLFMTLSLYTMMSESLERNTVLHSSNILGVSKVTFFDTTLPVQWGNFSLSRLEQLLHTVQT